jgi:hypothetical protein
MTTIRDETWGELTDDQRVQVVRDWIARLARDPAFAGMREELLTAISPPANLDYLESAVRELRAEVVRLRSRTSGAVKQLGETDNAANASIDADDFDRLEGGLSELRSMVEALRVGRTPPVGGPAIPQPVSRDKDNLDPDDGWADNEWDQGNEPMTGIKRPRTKKEVIDPDDRGNVIAQRKEQAEKKNKVQQNVSSQIVIKPQP